jgi:ABC-type transport system involved in cytochrome bd biosynthesis fused ATPase/permease subunit
MPLQEPVMFCGTLRENVDPMRQYSDFAVQEAIKQAGLVGKALDTEVGVGGEGWSIGEKQLVRLISRAILTCDCISVCKVVTPSAGLSSACSSQKTRCSFSRRSHGIPG